MRTQKWQLLFKVAGRSAHLLVLAGAMTALGVGCATTEVSRPYVGYRAETAAPSYENYGVLPPRVRVETNGKNAGDSDTAALRGDLATALHQNITQQGEANTTRRYVMLEGAPAEVVSQNIATALRGQQLCADELAPIHAKIPGLQELLAGEDADTVVFTDARIHLTSGGRKAAQVTVVTLIAAAAVATVALMVYAASKGSSPIGLAGYNHPASLHMHHHMMAHDALIYMPSGERIRRCREGIELTESHKHGFFSSQHLDLAVAVFSKAGELLWYRSGKFPLDEENMEKNSRRLAKFLEGMP